MQYSVQEQNQRFLEFCFTYSYALSPQPLSEACPLTQEVFYI